jgi:hypothetical protein
MRCLARRQAREADRRRNQSDRQMTKKTIDKSLVRAGSNEAAEPSSLDQGREGGNDIVVSAPHRELRQNSVQPVATRAPSQGLGTGRRIRTPKPTRAPSQGLGTGRRIRTPKPASTTLQQAQQGPLGGLQGFLQNSAVLGSLGAGQLEQKLREKAEQFQLIMDFVKSPIPFAPRSTEINTSSTPEEIKSRKAEVQYQIQIMKAVLAVLAEELKDLEQARPALNADKQA